MNNKLNSVAIFSDDFDQEKIDKAEEEAIEKAEDEDEVEVVRNQNQIKKDAQKMRKQGKKAKLKLTFERKKKLKEEDEPLEDVRPEDEC